MNMQRKITLWGGNPPSWIGPQMLQKIEHACEWIAEENDISVESLFTPTHQRPVAWPRQELMVLIRQTLGLSLIDTGMIFNRDPGTVIHAEKCVRNREDVAAEKRNRNPKI